MCWFGLPEKRLSNMAYNDYGAFVFKDGVRRKDKEDAAAFGSDELLDFGNGARIYAEIANQMGGQEYQPWERGRHAILGDGNVRLALYKTGIEGACVYSRNSETGDITTYDVDDFLNMCGIDRGEYPSDYHEDMTKEEWEEHFRACDAYWAFTDDGYDLEFEIDGVKIHLDWQPDPMQETVDDEDDTACWIKSADIYRGRFHASMDEADGSHWECQYGACYGAGWSDVDSFGQPVSKFNHLDNNGKIPPYKVFSVCGDTFEEEQLDIHVIYDATGNVMAASYVEGIEGEDGYVRAPKMDSTLGSFSASYIDVDSFVNILNMGIALGRAGYDAAEKNYSVSINEEYIPRDAYNAVFDGDEETEKRFLERYKIDVENPDRFKAVQGLVDYGGWKLKPFKQLRNQRGEY